MFQAITPLFFAIKLPIFLYVPTFGDDDAKGSFRTNAAWHRKVRVQGLSASEKWPMRKRDMKAPLPEAGRSVLP